MATEAEIKEMEWLKKKCLGKIQHKSYTAADLVLQATKMKASGKLNSETEGPIQKLLN
jgi:hypothetical protein